MEDLRTELPLALPVRVCRVSLKDCWGKIDLVEDEDGKPSRFVICVHREANLNFQIDILIHEWAHALDWFNSQTPGTDHDDPWGIWYARCYRAVMND